MDMKKITKLAAVICMMTWLACGCGSTDNTIQKYIISNTAYDSIDDCEKAKQPDTLNSNENVYTNIHFIESPQGMEYTVNWYLDGKKIYSETKSTQKDMQDIVVYELNADQVTEGALKIEVTYLDKILLTKEIDIS